MRLTPARILSAAVVNARAAREALDPNGEHEWRHVPTSRWVIHKVGANYYKFRNDALGCVDFDTPGVHAAGDTTEDGSAVPGGTAYAAIPYAAGTSTVNIFGHTAHGIDYMTDGTRLKRSNRSPHDAVADGLRGTAKPAGYTWHHHQTKGRMDLIKTTVHRAFAHRGGFSIWGKG